MRLQTCACVAFACLGLTAIQVHVVKFNHALEASLLQKNAFEDASVRAASSGSGLDGTPSSSVGQTASAAGAAATTGTEVSSSAAAANSNAVIEKWMELFDEAASAAGSSELNIAQFVVLARKALSQTSLGGAAITEADLDKAFVLADADDSGMVDRQEFVNLMVLAQEGHVAGLSSSILNPLTWIKDGMFKAKLQEKAAQPSGAAAAFTVSANSCATATAAAQQEAVWRAHFAVAVKAAGRLVLSKSEFVVAALAAAGGEVPPSSLSSGNSNKYSTSSISSSSALSKNNNGLRLFELESADEADWAKAFEVADADASGYVDESEFVAVMHLNLRGHVRGLGGSPLNPLNWGQEGNFRASLGDAKMTASSSAAPTAVPTLPATTAETDAEK